MDDATPEVVSDLSQPPLPQMVGYMEMTSGLFPPPVMLAEYDRILPGFGRMLMEEWKAEGNQRRQMEREQLRIAARAHFIGQISGLMVAFAGLTCAYLCARIDQPTVAAVIGGASLVGLVAVFLGRKQPPEAPPQTPPTDDTQRG